MTNAETEIDLQTCELCGKDVPIEDAMMMDDTWICPSCYAEFKDAFNACQHEWEPYIDAMGDPGQLCKRCSGFVNDEDMHLFTKAPVEAKG